MIHKSGRFRPLFFAAGIGMYCWEKWDGTLKAENKTVHKNTVFSREIRCKPDSAVLQYIVISY